MSLFPRFANSPRRSQKNSHKGFSLRLRDVLALGLAALLFFAPLSFTVNAQQLPGAKVPDGDFFMLYQDENGDTVCRAATPAERLQLGKINTANLGLHPITPARREYDSKAHGDDATSDNVEPTKIILLGTAQLDNYPEAKAAFNRAALIWEEQIQSPIKIYIQVDFGPTNFGVAWSSESTLGSTSSFSTSRPLQTVRQSLIDGASTAEESALYGSLPASTLPTNNGGATTISISTSIARAMGLLNPVATPEEQAPRIGFNSNFRFDFDPTDGITSNSEGLSRTDFEAVAVHEIGHALGFTSRAGRADGTTPSVWDIFRFAAGTTLSTFGTAQRLMKNTATVSNGEAQYYFSGGQDLALSTGGADGEATGGDGNQSSHWKQRSLNGGVYIGIMDPRIPSNTRRQITVNDTTALNFMGYNLNNGNPPPPPPPPPTAPANNNFASAQAIVGCTGSLTSTNIGATKESGEPNHDPLGTTSSASVWYQWVAPVSGSVTMDTAGSATNFDTMLAIYTGNSVGALTSIIKNDDVASGNTTSKVTFDATAGVTYRIAVDGWGSESGNFVLNWAQSNCTQTATVQLSQTSYGMAESGGSLAIQVTRSNAAAPATVDYTTTDTSGLTACNTVTGVASSRCDYATTVGTLRFAAGETTSTIFIPVVDDVWAEGAETFTLTLSNPTGASLGSTTAASVTLTDNDANSNGTNPIDQNAFFVRQQYVDFLGREPDAGGFQGWQDVLNQCGITINPPCDKIEVSAGFFRSREFQERGYFIYLLYSSVGRIPLYPEFMPDFAKVSGFLSDAQLDANKAAFVNEFMARSDFQTRYGATADPNAYVTALLQTLGLPNHPTKAGWVAALTNGSLTRAQVLRELTESSEVKQKYNTEAFVIMQYFGYLRRSADASYLAWIDIMNQNPTNYRGMIDGFMNSNEYRKRFGQ
jgi:hypothetical protein